MPIIQLEHSNHKTPLPPNTLLEILITEAKVHKL